MKLAASIFGTMLRLLGTGAVAFTSGHLKYRALETIAAGSVQDKALYKGQAPRAPPRRSLQENGEPHKQSLSLTLNLTYKVLQQEWTPTLRKPTRPSVVHVL